MLIEISFLNLKHSVKYIELITAIIGSIYFFKYKYTYLKHFLILLWLIVLIEFFGSYWYALYGSNFIIYNIYHLINFTFLLYLYKKYVEKLKHKQWISYFIVFYILSFIVNIGFQNYLTQIQTIPFIVGAVFIIISISFYFLDILNSNKILYISKNLLFWISIGLLLYFVGKIPTRIIRNYWEEFDNYQSIFMVEYILSIIMNICFIIGFVCSEKDKQF
ncbi:hypothetical protein CW732_08765 [Olleya sp. Bg11-27]|nr:hypothetical protein CW732_08765 [Olleya sp. Bg11-27]